MAKLFKILAGIVLFLVLALMIFVLTLDLNQHKDRITAAIEDATGRQLHLEGDVHLALSLTPTLVMGNASFSNASWGSQPNMVSLEKFEVEVELKPFLSGDIQVNRIILIAPEILLETNVEGVGNWVFATKKEAGEITEEKLSVPSILLHDILIKDATISYNDGVTGENIRVDVDELTEKSANADAPMAVVLDLIYKNVPVSLQGKFGSLNQLLANHQYPIDVAILSRDTQLTVNGQINKPMEGKGFNLETKFNAESLDDIAKLVESEFPEMDAIKFSATVTEKNDSYSINTLKFNVGETDLSGDVTAKFSGERPVLNFKLYSNKLDLTQFMTKATEDSSKIDNSSEVDEQPEVVTQGNTQAHGRLSIPSLPFDKIKQSLLLADASIDITAKEVKAYGAIFADTTITAVLQAGNLTMKPATTIVEQGKLAANVGFSTAKDELNLALNVNINSLAKLSELAGVALPDFGQVNVSAELIADKAHYVINKMSMNAGNSDISGELAIKIGEERPEINAKLTSNMIDVVQLSSSKDLEEQPESQTKKADDSSKVMSLDELKEVLQLFDGNVSISAKQIKTDSSILVDTNLNVDLQNGGLKVEQLESNIDGGKVKGSLTFNSSAKKPDFDIKLDVDSLAKLSKIVGSDLPDISPINFSGSIHFDKENYSIKSMTLKAGETDLSGKAAINLSGKIPLIKATLSSNLIDLTAFESQASEPQKKEANKKRLFSEQPLDVAALKSVNATISLKANNIKTSSLAITKTDISVSLQGGNLVVKPLHSVIAGGELSGNVSLNTAKKSLILSTDLTLKGLEPNQIAELSDVLTGAKTDVDIKVTGQGKSFSQIMSGLNGKFIVKVSDGVIIDSVTGALGADVLSELVGLLNPFSKSEESTVLNCAVVNFDIKDGIALADEGIAISMDSLNILGDGDINLKNEALDISLKAEPKEGLGISASKFVSLVKLTGTLASPSPGADLGGTLSAGASLGTAVATGGLSLIAEGLLDRVTADLSPCETALGIKPKIVPQATPTKEAVTSKPAGSSKNIKPVTKTNTVK
ncbi:AsmA family protein [Pseudomonadota bacterium]|nr:AsmA family protein [Pseudomonadota bacterium]